MPIRGTRSLALVLATASLLALAACDTAEDRAEAHYQSAVELIEAGDVDRAIIELRNVFGLNGNHIEARRLYASTLLEQRDLQEAFSQYLLLSELEPGDLDARIRLARLAIGASDWELARRHGERAIEIAPDDPATQLIGAVLDYQAAIEDEDPSARRAAADRLRLVQADGDAPLVSAQVLIDNALRDQDFALALELVDGFLANEPETEPFQVMRLRILTALGDRDGIREQLERLVGLFPENEQYGQDLIRWYVTEGNPEAAETYIRERVASAEGDAAVAERVLLINFLRQTRGIEAAIEETEKYADAGIDDNLFQSLRAGLIFDNGDRDGGIAGMEEVVATAGDAPEGLRYKVALARMLQAVGNEVAARQRVEEVLAQDARDVEAIKMRARWLITEDKADEAIAALRAALQDAPEDPQVMAILANAHLRNGSRELSREMLALAAQTSNNAPQFALPYARFLIADDNLSSAEDTLLAALRSRPNDLETLKLLGQIYVRQEDWSRVERVEATMRRIGTDEAGAAADALNVSRLRGQDRDDEAFELLNDLATSTEGVGAPEVAIVRSLLQADKFDQAREYAESLVDSTGNSPASRMLLAAVLRAEDRFGDAEAVYREILTELPEAENVWRALYSLSLSQGDRSAARAVLNEALETIPDAPNLLWALAGFNEWDGDIDGSIAIYEKLYEQLPNSSIIANNLASLIATYRDDDASLERAFTIARRLRDTEVPAFQDTYGWIAYRRGDFEEAIKNLEPAAAALNDDPIVQFHYGMALSANGRTEDAIATLQAAIDLAGPADTRPQFERARAEIARLQTADPEENSGN